jgi:hypothetical protein
LREVCWEMLGRTFDRDLRFKKNLQGEVLENGFNCWELYMENGERVNKDYGLFNNQYINSKLNVTNYGHTANIADGNFTNIKLVLDFK